MCNNHMQHDQDRAQRRACRQHRSGYYGGGFGGLIMGAIILTFFIHSFWLLFPLLCCGIPLFLFVLRPALMNQSPARPEQQEPLSRPYTRGYQAQQPPVTPVAATQERRQQDEPFEQTRQYEEPLTMYPRE